MKEHYVNYLTKQVNHLKNQTKHLEINYENLYVAFSPDDGYDEYTIITKEKYNPSKHSFDYIKKILKLEKTFSPIPKAFYSNSTTPIEYEIFLTFERQVLDLCPQLIAGCKFIPFPCLDESGNEIYHSPDGKLLIYFFNSNRSNTSQIYLLEKLINKIKALKHIEYKLANLIDDQDMSRSELEEKFEFIKQHKNYDFDMRIEKMGHLNRLYNIFADLCFTRVIIVNLFEKVIFNGPLYYEENIDYIIGKINENAFKENFEVTEEDEFMGKIASRHLLWIYGKEPLEKFKNKPVPEIIEDKHACVFSFHNNTILPKYIFDIIE